MHQESTLEGSGVDGPQQVSPWLLEAPTIRWPGTDRTEGPRAMTR